MIKQNFQVAGYYKIEAIKPDGARRLLADWFPNLITDLGLNAIGSSTAYMDTCVVGSGTTPPLVTNTALEFLVGSHTSSTTGYSVAQSEPYYCYFSRTYRFGPGVADGNLSEVGVGYNSTNLFSRALILDSLGNPTTITVLPDETLDVSYQKRIYTPTTDIVGSIVLDGVTYSYTSRASYVATSYDTNENSFGWFANAAATTFPTRTPLACIYAIGAVTSGPSTAGAREGTQSSTYAGGTLYSDTTISFGLTQGNVSGGIKSLLFRKGPGCFQVEFTPYIPKDATKTLSLVFRHSWARRV